MGKISAQLFRGIYCIYVVDVCADVEDSDLYNYIVLQEMSFIQSCTCTVICKLIKPVCLLQFPVLEDGQYSSSEEEIEEMDEDSEDNESEINEDEDESEEEEEGQSSAEEDMNLD